LRRWEAFESFLGSCISLPDNSHSPFGYAQSSSSVEHGVNRDALIYAHFVLSSLRDRFQLSQRSFYRELVEMKGPTEQGEDNRQCTQHSSRNDVDNHFSILFIQFVFLLRSICLLSKPYQYLSLSTTSSKD